MNHDSPYIPASARLFQELLDHSRVNEAMLFPPARNTPELELQARWFNGEFGRQFASTDGQKIEIIQFGEWNRGAGPDFIQAAVSIDDSEPLAGAIELDTEAEDWERHGHATNPAYNKVVLHLFFQQPAERFFTITADHRQVPQVQLDLAAIEGQPLVPAPPAIRGRCAPVLAALNDSQLEQVIHSAAWYRLHRKARQLSCAINAHGADQAVYQALARALGYSGNTLPFLLLAQKLPLKSLRQSPDSIEHLLFGYSGFLDSLATNAKSPTDAAYLKSLWARWWKERHSNAPRVLDRQLWHLAGTRPANHPQRRLAALALIAHQWARFRKALDTGGASAASEVLADLTHPYWSHHYTLTSKPSPSQLALLGDNRILDIQTNVLMPFLHANGRKIEHSFLNTRTPLSNREVDVACHRLLPDRPDATKRYSQTIAGQQGLLEIYHSYCCHDLSDCLQCPFPENLSSASAEAAPE